VALETFANFHDFIPRLELDLRANLTEANSDDKRRPPSPDSLRDFKRLHARAAALELHPTGGAASNSKDHRQRRRGGGEDDDDALPRASDLASEIMRNIASMEGVGGEAFARLEFDVRESREPSPPTRGFRHSVPLSEEDDS